MKQILLTTLLSFFVSGFAFAQRVHISSELFTNAVTALAFTSDDYGRMIDHQLYEDADLLQEDFVTLSTGTVDAPYHLSVILRAASRPYLLATPVTAVTYWQHNQDTLWSVPQAVLPQAKRERPGRGRFHLLITHTPKPKAETLRQFGLLNFRGNKFDFETSPCGNYNLHKIGDLIKSGVTSFRFGDGSERPHVFHLQSDDDDRYREILLPAYRTDKDDFVLDYHLLPESSSPVEIALGDHAMRTLSVFATTMNDEELYLGGSGAKCPINVLSVRPVVGEPMKSYRGRFEYYDVVNDKYVRTVSRQKQVDFLDELSFSEIPFYPFDFNFLAHDAVLNLEGDFESWRLDFSLPKSATGSGGNSRPFSYYQNYGESYRAPGNWSVVGSSFSSGIVELPRLPAGLVGKFFPGRSELVPEVYGVSVTTESEDERITYTLRKKGSISQPLLEKHLSGRRN